MVFDKYQLACIKDIEGRVVVHSSPGSGKTACLTHRVGEIIASGADPSRIVVTTFTNQAAKEMRERLFDMIGYLSARLRMGTFHSLGCHMLRNFGGSIGVDSRFTIQDDHDTMSIISSFTKDFSAETRLTIRDLISKFKNDLLCPGDAVIRANSWEEKKAAEVYLDYTKELNKNNALDFDDLLLYFVKLLESPNGKQIIDDIDYVLVDEAHDMNYGQYRIAQLLASKHDNLFLVGDVFQSIYKFRNGSPRYMMYFEKSAKVHHLYTNYRSKAEITQIATNLMEDLSKFPAGGVSAQGTGGKVELLSFHHSKDEVEWVARDIAKCKNAAVLYRTNYMSRELEHALSRNKIPYKICGSLSFFERKEIKDAIACLKVMQNEKDDVALIRCLKLIPGIGDKTIEKAINKYGYLYPALSDSKCFPNGVYVDVIRFRTVLLDRVNPVSSIVKWLINIYPEKQRRENLVELMNHCYNGNIQEFLDSIMLQSIKEDTVDCKVSIMNMHQSKGLEFDTVYIIGLEEGIMPHINSIATAEEEEERKLFYVSITRAKERLVLTYANTRKLFGQSLPKMASRFLDDL